MIDWSRKGKWRMRCPSCDCRTGFSVTNVGDKCVAHCFGCKHVERPGDASIETDGGDPEQRYTTLAPWAQRWWDEAEAVHSVGLSYLKARGCVIPPRDGDLRYHFALKHSPSKYVGPALVALITDPLTSANLSLHRTWITADGKKATDPGKMYLARHSSRGVCRLWPDEAVQGGLAIAEGIETALSLAHAFTPVWAALDAGNLAAFPVLPGVESLTIAADHDQAGIKAAQACARRWKTAGREVRIVMAPAEGQDLNDLAVAA